MSLHSNANILSNLMRFELLKIQQILSIRQFKDVSQSQKKEKTKQMQMKEI